MTECISIYLNTNRKLLLFLYDYDVQFNYTDLGDKIMKILLLSLWETFFLIFPEHCSHY